jgi:hypothetical protein
MPVRAIVRSGRLDYQVFNFGENMQGALQDGIPSAPDQGNLRLSVVKPYSITGEDRTSLNSFYWPIY